MTVNCAKRDIRKNLMRGVAASVLASMLTFTTANAIVPGGVGDTAANIVDTAGGVNGVGMFFRADGSVCSGTLINPRTVLFAAHCVNNVSENTFGPGGLASAFSFNVNALPGFQTWFGNGFRSDTLANVFNVSQIQYNPDSLTNPGAFGFLEGDIALATLDTPAAGIPTWALLFSALPAPSAIDPVTGTGYHVNISGYGRSGTGATGASIGIDFRRRAAENFLGALTTFDDRNTFLFGQPFGNLPQNLYRLDFDSPDHSATFDFNLYRDDATPHEGTTAGGDSGGPLILDAASNDIVDRDIVIGALSGGSRFFGGQVFSAFGTESFYQPLYLFADYIAAASPYRYVGAQAGDGNWEDASHWVTNLDPNFFIFNGDGALVNGFPDEQSGGITGGDPQFGQVCFFSTCQDLNTGEIVSAPTPASDGGGAASIGAELSNNVGRVDPDTLAGLGLGQNNSGDNTASIESREAVTSGDKVTHEVAAEKVTLAAGDPLPAPTLDNGLVGATDFVPDNIDADGVAGINGRYFDVTFAAAGRTTLNTVKTIDRLTISGGQSTLDIAGGASLTSLIDITQSAGLVNVDGFLRSVGDYTMFGGVLSGTGTINSPFLTNILGTISPGGVGGIGTLTIDGSAVLTSGSQLLTRIGANGVNDLLAITGDVSLGGTATFVPTADVRAGNTYTFLTADGAITNEFNFAQISAILQPVITVNGNSVVLKVEAASFDTVIDATNAVQSSYSQLLDQNRTRAAAMDNVYGPLDLASGTQIRSILDGLAPVTETTVQSLAKATSSNLSRFYRNRLRDFNRNDVGGTVSVIGAPLQLVADASNSSGYNMSGVEAGGQDIRSHDILQSDIAIYLAGAYINGDAKASPNVANFSDDSFDGWFVAGGIEKTISDQFIIGGSLSYTNLAALAPLGQTAESQLLAGTLYGQAKTATDLILQGQVSLGSHHTETTRNVAIAQNFALATTDNSLSFGAEVDLSKEFTRGRIIFAPGVGARYQSINFGSVDETGGGPALTIAREDYASLQARAGFEVRADSAARVQLRVSANAVHEFQDQANSFGANFAGGAGPLAPFALSSDDKDWFEVGGGVQIAMDDNLSIDLSVDSTFARTDVQVQTIQAGVSMKF